jgi:electron transfer flavoprotein alpha subunit
MQMPGDVLVFGEQRGNHLHPGAAQCVTAARELAAASGGKVVGVVIGGAVDAAADALDKAGVDRLIVISDPSLELYSAPRYRTALVAAIEAVQPRAVLMPATFMARDLAPRVAMRAKAALSVDVVAISAGEGGAIEVRRPIYNGKAFGSVTLPAGKTAIIAVRVNTFVPATGAGGAARETIAFAATPGDDRQQTVEIQKTAGEVKDVTEADIVVTGGRSLKSEENFHKLLYPLAKALDAAVGASRAACDAGYQPHSRQVGLTGKTVTPKLYIACGVSGAIQHLAGMRGSKVIVAINTDKEAPITKVADYTVPHDLFTVVPLLTEQVKAMR